MNTTTRSDFSWIDRAVSDLDFAGMGYRWRQAQDNCGAHELRQMGGNPVAKVWKIYGTWGALSGCSYPTLSKAREAEELILREKAREELSVAALILSNGRLDMVDDLRMSKFSYRALDLALCHFLKDKMNAAMAVRDYEPRRVTARFANALYAADSGSKMLSLIAPIIPFSPAGAESYSVGVSRIRVRLSMSCRPRGLWEDDIRVGNRGKMDFSLKALDSTYLEGLVECLASQSASYLNAAPGSTGLQPSEGVVA